MLKSSVIKIVKTLTMDEISQFSDFLNSPYHNKKSGVVKLFNLIIKYFPDFADDNLKKERLWVRLYPQKRFNYGVMKNLIYDITKLAEEFIIQQEYRSNEIQEFANLLKALGERKLKSVLDNKETYFNKRLSDENLKNINIPTEDYFRILTKIYDIKLWQSFFFDNAKSLRSDFDSIEDNFLCELVIQLFNNTYMSLFLSITEKKANFQKCLSNSILEIIMSESFDKILVQIKSRSEVKYNLLNCYYLAYQTLSDIHNAKKFFSFKKFFHEKYREFSEEAVRDLDECLDYCSALNKDKAIDNSIEIIERFRFRLQNDIVLDKNMRLNSMQFTNWLTLLIQENSSEDLQNFVNTYHKFIADDPDKSAVLELAESMILFMKSDYENSLSVLSRIKIRSARIKLIVKKFSFMVFYKLNDFEVFTFAIDSMNHFVDYNKGSMSDFSENWVTRSKDFCNTIKKLFLLRETMDKSEIELFEKQIINKKICDMKIWLLREITTLKTMAKPSRKIRMHGT